jgi:hypothetical protein
VSVIHFDPAELGPYQDRLLDEGGQGKVFGAPAPPGGLTGEYVYKEYLPGVSVSADLLEQMAGFLDSVGPDDRRLLDSRLAWPIALGRHDARLTGFLMRRVPTAFFIEIAGSSKAQSLQYLLNAQSYQRAIGLHVDDAQRLELLKDLAVLIARLHLLDVVVGDLSPKNVLFTLLGRPRCLLIDCDSMRYRGQSVVEQVDTTGWELPDGEEKATPFSDALKFGRLAVRLFNGDQDSLDAKPLVAISPALADLARQSQLPAPGSRPTVDDWVEPLEHALDRMLDEPPVPDPQQTQTAQRSTLYATPSPPPPPAAAPAPPQGFVLPPRIVPSQNTPYGRPPRPPGRAKGLVSLAVSLTVLALLGFGIDQASGGSPSQDTGLSTTQDSGQPGVEDTGLPTTEDTGLPSTQDTALDPGADDSSGGYPDTSSDPGTEESTTPDLPSGQLGVDTSAVDTDSEAVAVGDLFSRFYGAIDAQDYDTALSLYDPQTTSVDVNDDASRSRWKHTMRTTQESDVALVGLTNSGSDTMASVTFRSHQDAGYGPGGAEDETCTDWAVTYELTSTDGEYHILKAPRGGVSHTGC